MDEDRVKRLAKAAEDVGPAIKARIERDLIARKGEWWGQYAVYIAAWSSGVRALVTQHSDNPMSMLVLDSLVDLVGSRTIKELEAQFPDRDVKDTMAELFEDVENIIDLTNASMPDALRRELMG